MEIWVFSLYARPSSFPLPPFTSMNAYRLKTSIKVSTYTGVVQFPPFQNNTNRLLLDENQFSPSNTRTSHPLAPKSNIIKRYRCNPWFLLTRCRSHHLSSSMTMKVWCRCYLNSFPSLFLSALIAKKSNIKYPLSSLSKAHRRNHHYMQTTKPDRPQPQTRTRRVSCRRRQRSPSPSGPGSRRRRSS